MSQENLAEILDVSRQAISKWESGQSYPEMDKMIALSELFSVTMDSLVKNGELKKDNENVVSQPFWFTRGRFYEYKSKRSLFGLPIVHVNIGGGMKKAKGIIAVGNNATGIVAVGLLSKGVISFGLLSLGLISIGVFALGILFAAASVAVGIFAVGAIAVGIISIGAVSIGMFSMGACSVASNIAVGDYANGYIAIGHIAHGAKTFIDNSPKHDLSTINRSDVKAVINKEYPNIWPWISDLMTSMVGN